MNGLVRVTTAGYPLKKRYKRNQSTDIGLIKKHTIKLKTSLSELVNDGFELMNFLLSLQTVILQTAMPMTRFSDEKQSQ